MQDCKIQNPESEKIAKYIFNLWNKEKLSIYQEKTRKGLLRHIVIKIGVKTQEIMCILVINGKEIPNEKEIIEKIIKQFPKIKTIIKNINTKNTNVILGQENINIYGNGFITDKLENLTFKISPLSFYQVNPTQTEKLYKIGVQSAKITNTDIVFDLYCGIGTISLFMAQYAKQVYGVEIVEQAIEMAKENAKYNNLENTKFIAGDVEKVLDDLIKKQKIIPDVVMIDPPRKGLDKKSIQNLLDVNPKRLVYISCNPSTLVRDLAFFEEKYKIKNITPVDMFPYTSHVECVTVLELKKTIEK